MWYQAPYCGTRSQNCLVCKIGLLRWIWFHKLELLRPKKLKISFNKIDEILIVTLKIYTCSCWRFRLWIVLDSFLSNNPLTDVAKSLWTMRRALSWKWFIVKPTTMNHPDQRAITELRNNERLHKYTTL